MCPDDCVALVTLARAEGRRVDIDQQFRAAGHEFSHRFDVVILVPEIFADGDAQSHLAAVPERHGDGLSPFRLGKESFVIEIAVARQKRLVRALEHDPVADDRRGVVLPDASAFVPRVGVEVDEADDRGNSARRGGDALHRPLVGGEESGVLDQIADAITRQGHFRRQEEVRAARGSGFERRDDSCGVPLDVAARGVQLGERNAHGLCRIRTVLNRKYHAEKIGASTPDPEGFGCDQPVLEERSKKGGAGI